MELAISQPTELCRYRDVVLRDLLEIHQEKIRRGKLSIPPIIWCRKKMHIYSKSNEEYKFNIKGVGCNWLDRSDRLALYSEQYGEYMASPCMAKYYQTYEPSGTEIEEAYRAQFIFSNPDLQIEVEVNTPVGRIDCLTNNKIIEIKAAKSWKAGLGQVLAYGLYLPNHQKVLMLYGKQAKSALVHAPDVCNYYGVEIEQC